MSNITSEVHEAADKKYETNQLPIVGIFAKTKEWIEAHEARLTDSLDQISLARNESRKSDKSCRSNAQARAI